MENIGRIIRKARQSKGLGQRELAELVNKKSDMIFDHIQLSKIENDRRSMQSLPQPVTQALFEILEIEERSL